MSRGAFLLALAGWFVVSAIGGGHAMGENAMSLEDVRAALAKVHGTSCKAQESAAVFDYHELARRALGRHWRDRTQAERGDLVDLLRGHFLGWYSRLCERQDLLHFEAPVADGDRAVLSARAIREGRAAAVVYRLKSSDTTRWLVYDVEVAGRSHARTLYAEFDRILLNEGYPDLIARLTGERAGPRAASAGSTPRRDR